MKIGQQNVRIQLEECQMPRCRWPFTIFLQQSPVSVQMGPSKPSWNGYIRGWLECAPLQIGGRHLVNAWDLKYDPENVSPDIFFMRCKAAFAEKLTGQE